MRYFLIFEIFSGFLFVVMKAKRYGFDDEKGK